jgi:transposase
MKIIYSKFNKVADFCYELFRLAELKLYRTRYSKKCYTQLQHLFLLVYKQYRKFTYRELLEDLADNISLREYLGLNKLPHYTTLVKFAKRLPSLVLHKLVTAFKHFFSKAKKVAIDATGISLDNASPHYCKRIGKKTKKRPFLKLSVIVDIMTYGMLVCKSRKKTRHDTIDAYTMLKKLSKNYRPESFYADRGYDSNKLFKQVFEELGAYPFIFQRRLDVPKHRRQGTYRKKTINTFDYGEYLQRNKVETAFSILKRKFGFSIRSRNQKLQLVECMTRIIAYNIDRLIETGQTAIIKILIIMRISY